MRDGDERVREPAQVDLEPEPVLLEQRCSVRRLERDRLAAALDGAQEVVVRPAEDVVEDDEAAGREIRERPSVPSTAAADTYMETPIQSASVRTDG